MTDVSVVIPSIKDEVLTLESVPEGVDTRVIREGTLNEARNEGVLQAEHDRIIILDDDISFSETFFWDLADEIERGKLVGHPDWDYGLVAGRVMAFHRGDWERFGGFDAFLQSHMGDTDFALNYTHADNGIEHINPEEITHEPHERSITSWDRTWRTAYIAAKHPRFAWHIVLQTIA